MPDLKELIVIENEQFGKPISTELSDLLKKYCSKDTIADVARLSKVGQWTLKSILYRERNLTENNSEAIHTLIEYAKENAQKELWAASAAVAYLKSIIKPE